MRILGIDPGYAILGYGVLDMKGNRFSVVTYGSILTDSNMDMPARLQLLYDGLCEISCSSVIRNEGKFLTSRIHASATVIATGFIHE